MGIDPNWQNWSPQAYREALQHPVAIEGYTHDITALRDCNAVVYVLPCGKSASWEFGYAMGQNKRGFVVAFEPTEPELMFREATIVTTMEELLEALKPVQIHAMCRPPSESTDVERWTGDGWIPDDGKPGLAFSGLEPFHPCAWTTQCNGDCWDSMSTNPCARTIAMNRTCDRFRCAIGQSVAPCLEGNSSP